ncbi:MAG: asparaginase [Chloroflexota bacterium]
MTAAYQPIYHLIRGNVVESVHFGAIVVVDSTGRLLAAYGDPKVVTFTRSSAKPLQALAFIEQNGDQAFHLTSKEIAALCASHDGTAEHVAVIQGLQAKVGIQESDLLSGAHYPYHLPTAEAMKIRGEVPSPNQHNCSGKHTGMLAFARMRGLPISDYINTDHPIQKEIAKTFAEMCGLPLNQVEIGNDNCSVPNFAVPLQSAALGMARLCDPRSLSTERAAACRRITQAMMANPVMVAGSGRFDTRLMEVCSGRMIAKAGAEGYHVVGIMAGALGVDMPGIGIAVKVSDGDVGSHSGLDINLRIRPAVTLEVLRQMGYITEKEQEALAEFGPIKKILNWRKTIVGEGRPAFTLERENSSA